MIWQNGRGLKFPKQILGFLTESVVVQVVRYGRSEVKRREEKRREEKRREEKRREEKRRIGEKRRKRAIALIL
jgi:hypothetical protein